MCVFIYIMYSIRFHDFQKCMDFDEKKWEGAVMGCYRYELKVNLV